MKSSAMVIGVFLAGLCSEMTYANNPVNKENRRHDWMTQTEFAEGYIALGERDYVDGKEVGLTRYRVTCWSGFEESITVVRYTETGYRATGYDDGGHFGFFGDADSRVDVIEKGNNGAYPHTRLRIHEDYASNKREFDAANEILAKTKERFKGKLLELGNSEAGKEENLLDCINKIQFGESGEVAKNG